MTENKKVPKVSYEGKLATTYLKVQQWATKSDPSKFGMKTLTLSQKVFGKEKTYINLDLTEADIVVLETQLAEIKKALKN